MKLATFALLCLLGAAVCVQAGRHNAAQIFNGAYQFVNGTSYAATGPVATRDSSLGALTGTIIYAPAYPGALFGNMSVAYGNLLNASANCSVALNYFSAYTGPYIVFPDAVPPYVVHYPIINSNPINPKTATGAAATRYYTTSDDDNTIALSQPGPPVSSLFWTRIFRYPPAPACTLAVSITAAGAGWVSNGVYSQQYNIAAQNVGAAKILTANIIIDLAPGQAISSSWNIQHIGTGEVYSLALYSGLDVGQSQNSAGFIVTGTGAITVGSIPDATLCV